MKTCKGCGKSKPLSEYNKTGVWTIYMAKCKTCMKEYSTRKNLEYRKAHPKGKMGRPKGVPNGH